MQYGWKGARAYFVVGLRLFALAALQRLGVKAYDFDDGTALRAFALTLPFEAARTVAPIGFSCEHATMTAGNGLLTNPKCSVGGCVMSPVFAHGDEVRRHLSPITRAG